MYKVALRDCEKAIELNEKQGEYYNLRGMCWMNLDNFEKALTDFEICISLNEKFGSAY
jgi:tetratricopeptide (TPR) repeat protein